MPTLPDSPEEGNCHNPFDLAVLRAESEWFGRASRGNANATSGCIPSGSAVRGSDEHLNGGTMDKPALPLPIRLIANAVIFVGTLLISAIALALLALLLGFVLSLTMSAWRMI
jgi:hypothetical protein